ncbi:MAG: N-acetylmuramate alpha-1-phosphate uridylyltransferase MurU [Pseudomonadota bacterium]
MILAAGRGKRMGSLTQTCPKPLLQAGGVTLIEHVIAQLLNAGIREFVINHAYLGHRIVEHLGDGRRFGADIVYAAEPEGALETGGGIMAALPLLGPDPFLVANADVWCDLDLATLPWVPAGLAHLVLVANPDHHAAGDFAVGADGRLNAYGEPRFTMAGISVFRPELWNGCRPGRFRIPPLLRYYMGLGQVSGEVYAGRWSDVGTPERLAALDAELRRESRRS